MDISKNMIFFTLVYQGEEYQVQTKKLQYRSLMTLVSDHLGIVGFGVCCGMGSCGTCRLDIEDAYSGKRRSVLACGISINDELDHSIIHISDGG